MFFFCDHLLLLDSLLAVFVQEKLIEVLLEFLFFKLLANFKLFITNRGDISNKRTVVCFLEVSF